MILFGWIALIYFGLGVLTVLYAVIVDKKFMLKESTMLLLLWPVVWFLIIILYLDKNTRML